MKQDTYLNLLGEPVSIKDARKKPNPLVKTFGPGPEGEHCKNCKHLFWRSYSKTYYKCRLRDNNESSSTDHRVNWPACGKFEPPKTLNS